MIPYQEQTANALQTNGKHITKQTSIVTIQSTLRHDVAIKREKRLNGRTSFIQHQMKKKRLQHWQFLNNVIINKTKVFLLTHR